MTASGITQRSRNVTLVIITLVVAVNYVDRYVLSILLEPIRADLKISDTQIGLLTGAGFALLYTSLAIPVARLAERYNRVLILTVAVLVWSAATALSGVAQGFALLLCARMMVGCGEAGAMAPSLSMIADLYTIERRSSAMAMVGIGTAIGTTIAPALGGWLYTEVGWRMAFVLVGLAGLPLALLLTLFVRDPPRGLADGAVAAARPPAFAAAMARLFRRPSFVLLIAGLIPMAIGEYSVILWIPSVFHRNFGIDPAELGARLAVIQGVPFFLGTWLGGAVTDRLSRRDRRWIVWVPMLAAAITVPAVLGLCAARSEGVAFAFLAVPSLASGLYIGPCYALVQNLAAVHSRATATAVLAFSVNLVGAGFGPSMIGMLSDFLSARFGDHSLIYAFYSLVPLYAIATVVFAVMGMRLIADLEDARRDSLGGYDDAPGLRPAPQG